MLSAKFGTIFVATNSSFGINNCFFDHLGLLAINPCLVPDGCHMTSYSTAHVPSTWISKMQGYLSSLKI